MTQQQQKQKAAELTEWIAEHVAERSSLVSSIDVDLEYALSQLNRGTMDGIRRATDALRRCQENLNNLRGAA